MEESCRHFVGCSENLDSHSTTTAPNDAKTKTRSKSEGNLPWLKQSENSDSSCRSSEDNEKEKWLQVRRTLLQSPKLFKAVEEINEKEWNKSRVSSLKRVLEACGNYHGGPKGEVWLDLAGALTRHLGPQHEFLEIVSDYQDSLWTTCSLVTVTTLDSETSLDGLGDIIESGSTAVGVRGSSSTSTTAVLPASASCPLQVYGSIDLIQPSGKDGHRLFMHHFHWKWLLLYVPLLLVLSAAVVVAVSLLQMHPEDTKRVDMFESTTVYLDSQQGRWYRGWEVEDCSSSSSSYYYSSSSSSSLSSSRAGAAASSGDDQETTVGQIQLVDSNDVEYFEDNMTDEDGEGYKHSLLPKTLNGPLYLLPGSLVEYQFCLTTNFSAPNHHLFHYSEFLIFNDYNSYTNYVSHRGERGRESAIFYDKTPIPPTLLRRECSNVTFRVSKADTYFTTFKLPPHVELYYHSNIHVVYLNYTKYLPKERMECSLEPGGSCEIAIPENTFSSEEYTILAYIPLRSSSTVTNSTHLCVTPKRSVLVSVLPGVLSGFVLLLLGTILVCQFVSFVNSIRRKKGYFCIKPINL